MKSLLPLIIFIYIIIYSNILNSQEINKFEYQIGISTNNENYMNLKGEIIDIYKIKLGLEMTYFRDDYRTDSGIFIQINQ